MCFAPLVLTTPFLLAQQDTPAHPAVPPQPNSQQSGLPPQRGMGPQGRMHRGPGANRQGGERRADAREQRTDERMDLDELGLPEGEFWTNPEVAAQIGMTPDQVHRIADTYLQGTLKLIQLDANLQMEEAKLEPMLGATPLDTNATLAQIERIADDKAAIDKADARLAFALRATLTPEQLAKMQASRAHHAMQHEAYGPGDGPMQEPQR